MLKWVFCLLDSHETIKSLLRTRNKIVVLTLFSDLWRFGNKMLFMIKCCSQDNCASQEEFIFTICTLLSCYSLQRLNVQEDATIASDLKKPTPSYSGETTYDRPVNANGILSHYTLGLCFLFMTFLCQWSQLADLKKIIRCAPSQEAQVSTP